jgi:hypothetical protein
LRTAKVKFCPDEGFCGAQKQISALTTDFTDHKTHVQLSKSSCLQGIFYEIAGCIIVGCCISEFQMKQPAMMQPAIVI